MRAQVHQPGKAAHARHAQIEQDEVDFAAALKQPRDVVEGAGLADVGVLEQTGDRCPQGAAEQRMVVGDDQPVMRRIDQRFRPSV